MNNTNSEKKQSFDQKAVPTISSLLCKNLQHKLEKLEQAYASASESTELGFKRFKVLAYGLMGLL
jgi:hypothetical protein